MNLRDKYTVNNIMWYAGNQPAQVLNDIDSLFSAPELQVHGIGPEYNLIGVSHELAYWSNLNASLEGLAMVVKLNTDRTNKIFMAVRDGLFSMAQAARQNYEATSRVLTSYERLAKDTEADKRAFR